MARRVSFKFPNKFSTAMANAFAEAYGYPATVPNPLYTPGGVEPETIPNPQTKEQFAQGQIVRFCKEVVKGYLSKQAQTKAQTSIAASVAEIEAVEPEIVAEDVV